MIENHPALTTSLASIALFQYRLKLPKGTIGLVLLAEASEIFSVPVSSSSKPMLTFRDYFALTILAQPSMTDFLPCFSASKLYTVAESKSTRNWVDTVCDIFERILLFRGPEGDYWDEGKYIFKARI